MVSNKKSYSAMACRASHA